MQKRKKRAPRAKQQLQLVLSPASISDLYDIHEYIGKNSLRAADMVMRRILQECEQLQHFPLVGHLRKEFSADVAMRTVSAYSCLVFYQVTQDAVLVHRVLHEARAFPLELFTDFEL